MSDLLGRIGSLLAVGSGLGYVIGAATLAEFARALGLRAADLGVGPREYVIVAVLAFLSLSYLLFIALFVGAGFVSWWSDSVRVARLQAAKEGREISTSRAVFESLEGFFAFLAGLCFILAPIIGLAALVGDVQTFTTYAVTGVGASLVLFFAVILPASRDRRRRQQAARGRQNLATQSGPVSWTLRWASSHLRYSATAAVLIFLVTLLSATLTAASFGNNVLAVSRRSPSNAVVTPLLLRWVVHPASACVLPPAPAGLAGKTVIHIARTPSGEVLAYNGRTLLLEPRGIQLVFPSCPA